MIRYIITHIKCITQNNPALKIKNLKDRVKRKTKQVAFSFNFV